MYPATQTVQITPKGAATSSLRVHEMRPDGTPLCNRPSPEWRRQTMVYTPQGRGTVTCGLCARCGEAKRTARSSSRLRTMGSRSSGKGAGRSGR